jgi:hypothetical protein
MLQWIADSRTQLVSQWAVPALDTGLWILLCDLCMSASLTRLTQQGVGFSVLTCIQFDKHAHRHRHITLSSIRLTLCDADGSRHIGQRCSTFELVSEASDAIHTTIKKQDFPYSFWLRDDSLEESANLPSPDVLGQLS